ncbi:MAG: hypothetical protein WC357_03050 [Candidatus Omnitrophota bacterium]|jgi:hypothetical protein
MAYPNPKIQKLRDDIIRVYHPEILEPQTYLTADLAATGTANTVANNDGWVNEYLILYEGYDIENAEIKMVNAAVTAGTSLTSTAVTFAHSINCPLKRVLFNQIEISGASSLTGVKSDTTLINITVAQPYTDYVLSSALQAHAYIFVRFYNSLVGTPFYSEYSDGIATTDLTPKTLGFIKRNAFKNIGEQWGGRFTDEWFYDQIYLGELDVAKSLKRWSWLYSFDYDMGNLSEGQWRVALPTDIEDKMTNKSIMGIRVEGDVNLAPIDWTQYQNAMNGINHTTLSSAASVGDVKLVLTDSRDFADSGTVTLKTLLSGVVFSNSSGDIVMGTYTAHGLATGDKINVSGCTNDYCNTNWTITYLTANTFTLDNASWASFTGADVTGDVVPIKSKTITYTGNSRGTNTLTGITALTESVAASVDVWQNLTFGTPEQFSVNNGYIYFDIPPDSNLEGRNIWLDYYTTVSRKDSDGDEITVNDSNLMILWMEMAIKREKSNGELAVTDPSWIAYEQKKKQLIQNEISGQHLYLVPGGVSRNRPLSWLR